MKKINNIKKITKTFLHVVYLFVFNLVLGCFAGCGLDVLYVIDSPQTFGGTVDHNVSFDNMFFEFTTNEENDVAGLNILGTDVYYKIYDNLNSLISDTSAITNTDNNSSGRDKLTSKKYLPLKFQRNNEIYNDTLIPQADGGGINREIKIRLTDYQNISDFSAKIAIIEKIDNNRVETTVGIPMRNISNAGTFNFGRSGTNDRKPVSNDDDTYITNSNSTIFYVAMFAVTVAFDSAYTSYFSEPTYLGYVRIDSESENN